MYVYLHTINHQKNQRKMKNSKNTPIAIQITELILSGTKANLIKAIELGATPMQIMIIQAAKN